MASDIIQSPPRPSPEPSTPTPSTVPPPPSDTGAPATSSATAISEAQLIHIPSYSRWFSWNSIHESEVRFVPEFFNGRSPSKNPRVYKYYRNTIIKRFRQNPARKITFTEARKTVVGDVGSVRRVFDFLESWGLINFTPSTKPQLKWEEKDSKSSSSAAAAASQGDNNAAAANASQPKKRVCSGCRDACTIACFASDKHDMTLCARCFVRGNYRVGLSSTDFKRVEISQDTKTDWSDKETLQLLEAVMHYGDDWKKVAEHVSGKSEKECVARFIKLPFGEQFFNGPPDSADLESAENSLAKKMRLSPLADASNPIMAQAAFLSTLAGVDVAEVAARAGVAALYDLGDGKLKESFKPSSGIANQPESAVAASSNGGNLGKLERDLAEAKQQLEKEEEELEKVISGIAAETKEIEDKIIRFEEFDLQTEKKWQQLQQLQNLLFVDQLTLLFHKKTAAQKSGESVVDSAVKTEFPSR